MYNNQSSNGTLYLLPSYLGKENFVSPFLQDLVTRLKHVVCESQKGLTSFLARSIKHFNLSEYDVLYYNEHTYDDLDIKSTFLSWLNKRVDIGIISDAGLPGVADPGSELILLAHHHEYSIYPLAFESSITAALCASGLSGQYFMFHGYPPYSLEDKKGLLTSLLRHKLTRHYTHMFIETPYRSQQFMENLLHILPDNVLLSIAVELHTPLMFIRTRTVGEWKRKPAPSLKKKRAVFLFNVNQ